MWKMGNTEEVFVVLRNPPPAEERSLLPRAFPEYTPVQALWNAWLGGVTAYRDLFLCGRLWMVTEEELAEACATNRRL